MFLKFVRLNKTHYFKACLHGPALGEPTPSGVHAPVPRACTGASAATAPTPTSPRRALAASALAGGLSLAGEGVGAYVAKRGFHGIGLTTATATASAGSCTASSCTFIARPTGRAASAAWPSTWRRRPLRQGGARTPALTALTAAAPVARVYAACGMLARWGLQLIRPEFLVAIRL